MRTLHELPKFEDRWSHLYLEHGRLDVEKSSLLFFDKEGQIRIPIDQLAFVMLGPGTRISHAAMRCLADNNCLVCWTGENGVRLYAHSTGGTHSSRRLLRQVELWSNKRSRMRVIRRMYQMRFAEELSEHLNIAQIRSREGQRVRREYERIAAEIGVEWRKRAYNQDDWREADPLNRALSSATSCLYGVCHAAILSAGYSPAIGFIHTGNMLSFVYDVADFYKSEIAIPIAFQTAKESELDLERRTRLACRDAFYESKLMSRIIPDIAEALDATDDLGEFPGELEGRAVSMAD